MTARAEVDAGDAEYMAFHRLVGYTRHHDDCAYRDVSDAACSCGLWEAHDSLAGYLVVHTAVAAPADPCPPEYAAWRDAVRETEAMYAASVEYDEAVAHFAECRVAERDALAALRAAVLRGDGDACPPEYAAWRDAGRAKGAMDKTICVVCTRHFAVGEAYVVVEKGANVHRACVAHAERFDG